MKRKARILIGILLLIGGCACFLFPNIQEWKKQRSVDQIIERFEEAFPTQTDDTAAPITSEHAARESEPVKGIEQETGEAALETELEEASNTKPQAGTESEIQTEPQTEPQSKNVFPELYAEMESYNEELFQNGQEIVDAWSYEQTPLDLSILNSSEPVIGYIEIPDMNVRLPLFIGASTENLSKGAAVLAETSMPIGGNNTNCVIAGHRGWNGMAYFQRIENLTEGSKVYVTNPWETLVYEVVGTKIIDPNDVSSILIHPDEDIITLFTCHPYVIGGGAYRYLVFCKRGGTQERSSSKEVNNPKADPAPETSAEEIQIDTESMILPAETEKRTIVIREVYDDSLLNLEETLRIWLPVGTIILAAIIVIIRLLSSKKEEECVSRKEKNSQKMKKYDTEEKKVKKKKNSDKI